MDFIYLFFFVYTEGYTDILPLFGLLQVERAPKTKPVVEEFDYSDFYDDVSVSTVTSGPNVTEYEVRHPRMDTTDEFYPLLSR